MCPEKAGTEKCALILFNLHLEHTMCADNMHNSQQILTVRLNSTAHLQRIIVAGQSKLVWSKCLEFFWLSLAYDDAINGGGTL